jgi:hypothetical protein
MTDVKHTPHPRGRRELGTCAFTECTEDAVRDIRVTRGSGLALRVVVPVCEQHAEALESGMSVLLEFHKG